MGTIGHELFLFKPMEVVLDVLLITVVCFFGLIQMGLTKNLIVMALIFLNLEFVTVQML